MAEPEAFRLEERAGLCHVNVRGSPANEAFLAAARSTLGLALPVAANTVSEGGDRVAYWLGPDEWLVVGPASDRTSLAKQMNDAFSGLHAAATEVSGGQAVLVLAGPGAVDALASDCPLDLHPRKFAPGACAQTRFGKAAVLLRPVAGGFELLLRRSFAAYVRAKLDRG